MRVKVDGELVNIDSYTSSKFVVSSDLDKTIENNGSTVEISYKGTPDSAKYVVTLVNINDSATNINKIYNQYLLPVEVTFAQKDMWWTTKITASMDNGDNEVEIKKIEFKYNGTAFDTVNAITSISENSDGVVEIAGDDSKVQLVSDVRIITDTAITCTAANTCTAAAGTYISLTDETKLATCTAANTCTVAAAGTYYQVYDIDKATYNDYFRVDDTYLKIFKS